MRAIKLFGLFFILFVIAMPFLKTEKETEPVPTVQNSSQKPVEIANNPPPTQQNNTKIDENVKQKAIADVSRPFERHAYPKKYEKFGDEGMKEINAMVPVFAQTVANDITCDMITYVGISDESNVANPILFANCENGNKYITSKLEMQAGKIPELQIKK